MTLSDLPDGNVKSAVEKLPVEAQQRALLKLSRMNFRSSDEASVRVDSEGSIYYVCSFTNAGMPDENPLPAAESSADAGPVSLASSPQYAAVPITEPPIYHSKPGATKVLFLDFNGADISNTKWNSTRGVSVWHCRPFSIDTDETTFSDTEQRYIREMWERVAEDYAVFDVDVTTEEPAVWTQNTAHALITPTTDADGVHCPHYSYGGIAYLDIFGQPRCSYNDSNCYSPAWVTPMPGSSGRYDSTAEAASHELGHNMGLDHDGTIIDGVTNEYYHGHSNGSISWGPIMGAAYGINVSQWSKGEYYGANQFEDDLAIIDSKLKYKPDDYGNTIAQAAVIETTGGVFSVTGILERTGDSDMFSLTCGGGTLVLTGTTYRCSEGTWGGNADLVLTLYDADGTMLTSDNPELETRAGITQTVAGGTYYLEVSSTGVGNPMDNPPTGYTSYGSIGPYTIAGYQEYPAYTVTFDAQGGAVSPASITATNGLSYGDLPIPTRTGYTFGGWWTGAGGTGAEVTSATTVTITAAQTLYAKWTANSYTVMFDEQGGTVASPVSKSVTYNSTYGTLAVTTRAGYTFSGWWTGPNGTGSQVISSTTVSITTAQTLYAMWAVAYTSVGTPCPWLDQYGLVTGTNYEAAALADVDKDGLAAWQEYIAGTNPTNGASSFRVTTFKKQASGAVIQWSPVTGRVYGVHWTTNLKSSFQPLGTNIVWPQASYTDTVHGAESRNFYKVKVQLAP